MRFYGARKPRPRPGPIARATVRTSAVLGLRLAVQAGTLLLVARLLGPQQFGAFAGVAALAVMLGTLSTFGTHLVLLAEVSRDPARSASVLPFALSTTGFCGGALLALYLLIAPALSHEAGISTDVLIALGTTELLLQPLLSLPAMEHQGRGRIATSQAILSLPLILRLLAAWTIWLLRPADPLRAYAWCYLAASALVLIAATVDRRSTWPVPGDWRLPHLAELRRAAGYAALNLTASGPAELDKTLALRLLPLAAAGVYAAGARVIGALTLPVTAMMLSALPRLFREGQSDRVRSARLLRWIFAAALVYSVALAALLWFIAPAFVWLFGPKYHGIEHMIHWLCLAVPGMALRITAGSTLMALGKPWARVGFEIAGLVVLLMVALPLTAHFGEIGMPLALACSEWTMAIVGSVTVRLPKRCITFGVDSHP
ncbi:MAG: lipopolysaccharide biosynthesis protein [Gammaproteobacteria bacterium]|nr:lipopolysaccharide biosynthesis protein [Gammaproteobacteria bacterium]